MTGNELTVIEDIQSQIYTIRGVQVMLDEDLASLYHVETRVLNQAVKRNKERFPEQFCFQLTAEEYELLRSQIVILEGDAALTSQDVTLESRRGKHRKYLPYAFTEQGVAMLSAVLKSNVAVQMSVQIINAFVAMRRFISSNAHIFQRLDTLEIKQLETDKKINHVLNAIESKEIQPKQGIFFEGQIFDAYNFVADIIRTAQRSIIIIDNYVDDTVLTHLTKRNDGVDVTIFTKTMSKQLALDLNKFNSQYPPIEIREFKNSHDRFMIIDDKTVYHFGASLKDLGKKWFAFSKMDFGAVEMLTRLEGMK
ncbi:ORF6N domain-containing protein [Methanolobus sp. WCC1]|uniref:ORF6N domain-containing protein n=1 Tax=unclassified Methanolobus TaxID=2629569 RepID=UPI003250769A